MCLRSTRHLLKHSYTVNKKIVDLQADTETNEDGFPFLFKDYKVNCIFGIAFTIKMHTRKVYESCN